MATCKAILVCGDDYGDNVCTFHCQLEEGHEGKHRETGKLQGEFSYLVEWPKDMRPSCACCGQFQTNTEEVLCYGCAETICKACISQVVHDKDGFDLAYCKKCHSQGRQCQDCGARTRLACAICQKPTCVNCMRCLPAPGNTPEQANLDVCLTCYTTQTQSKQP